MQLSSGKTAYKTAAYLFIVFALSVLAHVPALQKYASIHFNYDSSGAYEDRSKKIGDFTYYLHGALSIYDFTVEKKFNGKHQPIIAQKRDIKADDMPWYAPYVLAIYPYPSFKFGYSLTAAVLTLPFPDSVFEKEIPRLAFANIILNAVSACLIFLIVRRLAGSIAAAAISSLFFIFDVSNTHNSYLYQSHTTSGIFYLLLAFLVFIQSGNNKASPLRFGLIAFLVALSVLSSSHIFPIAFFIGLLMFARLSYKERPREILKYTVAGLIGSVALLAYIVGVETFFKFQELGLPTLIAQLENYKSTVGALIRTYPPLLRMMWDVRLFNIFIVPILWVTAFIIVYRRFVLKKRKVSSESKIRIEISNNAETMTFSLVLFKEWLSQNTNSIIGIISIVAATGAVAFYTQPISRAMTPYTLLYGLLLGAYLGKRFSENSKLIKVAVLIILGLVVANYYLLLGIVKLPERDVPSRVFALDENEMVWKNTHEFFKTLRADKFEYRYISKSLEEFIRLYDHQLTDDTYLKFDGFDLVFVYSPTRRFIREFVPDPRDVVNQNTYLKDFRLLAEVFELRKKNLLRDEDIIRVKKRVWNFELWDQEYNYIYGYMNYVGKYLENTPLEGIEARYTYYINYGTLKNAYRLSMN